MKLSVPSYVVPGTWLENLRWLRSETSQRRVELLFFMYDDDTRAILRDELDGIRALASEFEYSAHLPDALLAAHAPLVDSLAGWVDSFVVHPPRTEEGLEPFCDALDGLRRKHGADRFFLENTALEPFMRADAALAGSALGPPPLCADAGHLVAAGLDPVPWIEARAGRIRELHLHGFDGTRDHVAFDGSEAWFGALSPFLKRFDGIVQLELFSWRELLPGMRALESIGGGGNGAAS